MPKWKLERIFRGIIIAALHIALIAGGKVGASAEKIGLKLGYAVEHFARAGAGGSRLVLKSPVFIVVKQIYAKLVSYPLE